MTNDPSLPPGLPQADVETLWKGNAIEAIKNVRLGRDLGLKESKDMVDACGRSHPALHQEMQAAPAESTQTFVRWLIGVILLVVAEYVFVSGE